jgi:hypothetical protein
MQGERIGQVGIELDPRRWRPPRRADLRAAFRRAVHKLRGRSDA